VVVIRSEERWDDRFSETAKFNCEQMKEMIMKDNNGNSMYDGEESFPFHILAFGALGGSLVGIGIGLLFAPWSGMTLRRRIRRYANRAVEDTIETGREALDTAMEYGKDYMENGIERMKKVAKHGWRDMSLVGRGR
jgi:gas vesicle protein